MKSTYGKFLVLLLLCSTRGTSAHGARRIFRQQDHSKQQQMEHRGNQGMGFDQQKPRTTFCCAKTAARSR